MRLAGDGCGNPDELVRDVRDGEMDASQLGRVARCLPGVRLAGIGSCGMRDDEGGKDSDTAKLA